MGETGKERKDGRFGSYECDYADLIPVNILQLQYFRHAQLSCRFGFITGLEFIHIIDLGIRLLVCRRY